MVSNQTLYIERTAFNGAMPNGLVSPEPAVSVVPGNVQVSLAAGTNLGVSIGQTVQVPVRIRLGSKREYTPVTFTRNRGSC